MQMQEKEFVSQESVSYTNVCSGSFSEKEVVGLFLELDSVIWVPWAVAEDPPLVGRGW